MNVTNDHGSGILRQHKIYQTIKMNNKCFFRFFRFFVPLSGIILLLNVPAHAQTPPDAGTLQREGERGRMLDLPRPALPAAPTAPMKAPDKGASVTVHAFQITGATLVPEAELNALLADLVGQTLTLADLERAAQRIAEHYRARGWFARVYLPAQEIRDGVVKIAVVEGRLGGIDVESSGSRSRSRSDSEFVRRVVARPQAIGEPLRADGLERALLLANDLPGIAARGVLEPGKTVGETRLRLKIEDTPLLAGDATLANNGIPSTGVAQLAAGLRLNSPSGRGDQLGMRTLVSRGSEMLRLHYGIPLNDDGLRLSTYVSGMRYRLGDDFAALDASGRANVFGLGLTYPWLRAQTANLQLGGVAETRRYADDSLGAPLHRRRADALALKAGGDRSDGLGRGGLTQAEIVLTAGRLDLGGNAADLAADQAGPHADGRYARLAASLSRLQRLPADFILSAAFSAQLAGSNLDSSEKFVLGGPSGVRAYPVNEGAGDEGWLFSLELRRELSPGWQAYALLDGGEVRLHRNEWPGWQGGTATPNHYRLSGAGLGLSWNRAGDFTLNFTVATPLGGNPGQTAAGHNGDGSNPRAARAWLSLGKLF